MGLRIKKLSTAVANQIAAGEVIERPASVVKELLENAYDAGANTILVEIGCGGLNQIKISDNGQGIAPEDLPLAIAAHATSKIELLTDLYAISSMGFRGEALASIASVAKLSICSKTNDQPHAMLLTACGEEIRLSPCARNQGTTIEVLDLFHNLPVRKKFLKSERLEFLAIDAVLRRFALSALSIHITFKHNDKIMLILPAATCAATQLKRMSKIFGKDFAREAVYIETARAGMSLNGWLSSKEYQRSQNDKQWVYINQRMVKDKLILHALKQVYEPYLYPGRFPSCLLYFNLPPEEVDINVHPAKLEVRFQEPRRVHDFFISELTELMREAEGPDALKTIFAAPTSEIREVHEYKSPFYQHSTTSQWIPVNSQYAVIFREGKVLLLDARKLQQAYLQNQLYSQDLPLAPRLLLVSFSYDLHDRHICCDPRAQVFLSRWGIAYEYLAPNQIRVNSVPLLLPQLDIKKLFQHFSLRCLEQEDHWLALLSSCQFCDVYHLAEDEKNNLLAFLSSTSEADFFKPLDEKACEVIFNG